MPSVTKTNGTGVTNNTLYVTDELYPVLIDTGANLASYSGNINGGALKLAVEELRPVMYQAKGTSGEIHAILDTRYGNAADVQARLQALGNVDGYNFSSATVTTVGNISFSA
jgi:hypothetical protein